MKIKKTLALKARFTLGTPVGSALIESRFQRLFAWRFERLQVSLIRSSGRNNLEMSSAKEQAAARETIVPAQIEHVSGSVASSDRKNWRFWNGACFAIVLL